MVDIPKNVIFEYELIINKKLYDGKVINEQQYDEICKTLYEKISRCRLES